MHFSGTDSHMPYPLKCNALILFIHNSFLLFVCQKCLFISVKIHVIRLQKLYTYVFTKESEHTLSMCTQLSQMHVIYMLLKRFLILVISCSTIVPIVYAE